MSFLVLDSPGAMVNKLRKMFSTKTRSRRRVIAVAFVGMDAPRLLPDYKDVEILCWPKAIGTHPDAIRILLDNKHAKVKFVDKLHSKLFWVEGIGAVIGSANLSHNGLEGGLTELGVFIPDCDERIRSIISKYYDKARAVTGKELRELERELVTNGRSGHRGEKHPRVKGQDFAAWYKGSVKKTWHPCWWDDSEESTAQGNMNTAREYGYPGCYDWVNFGPSDDYKEGDWLLQYELIEERSRIQVSKPQWFCIESITKVDRKEASYEKEYPKQAAQIHEPNKLLTSPPFNIKDKRFVSAFQSVVSDWHNKAKKKYACPKMRTIVERIASEYGKG